jgi:hypothetical protein
MLTYLSKQVWYAHKKMRSTNRNDGPMITYQQEIENHISDQKFEGIKYELFFYPSNI